MLEPGCIAHILIAASLSKVWYHALEFSISSHKIKDLLLTSQVRGAIGVQVNIEVPHEYWCVSIGWILVKSILDMSMEVIQALLAWQKVCANNRDLSDTSTVQATHAVVAVATYILQVVVGLDDSSPSWGIDGKGNPALSFGVCLSSNHVVAFKVLGMNHTVRVRVALLPSEACAGKKSEANSHVSHIKKCLLQPAVAATAKVQCRPVGGAIFLLLLVECPLEKGLPTKVILLLSKVGRDVRYRWSHSKDLV